VSIALLIPWQAQASKPALAAKMEARAQRFFADSQPGGVVLVRRGDEVLLRKAYGLANVENQTPMRVDSVLRLASASKQFTAMAILQLVQTGKIQLDQEIGSIDTTLPPALGKVHIRQLLTHTSGVTNISSIPASRAARRNFATPVELIAFFKDLPLQFEPATAFSYSNSNYILLSHLIEKLTGESYAEHMQRAIFAPLAMTHTRYDNHLELITHRVQGYQQDEAGHLLNADFIDMSQPQGAGGLLSTVDDLAKWDAALYGNRLIPQKLLAQAFAKVKLKNGSKQSYGFGWVVGAVQGTPSLEHGGFINGFNSQILRVPAQHVFVTVLTNSEALAPSDLSVELAAMAIGRDFDMTPADSAAGEKWLGRYTFANGVQRDILQIEGKLCSPRVGAAPIILLPTADGRFYFSESLNFIRFSSDAAGKVTMTIHDRLLGDDVGSR